MSVKPRLQTAANGHCLLGVDSAGEWQWLSQHLEQHVGARREGSEVLAAGESIYLNFALPECTLLAGWDDWFGYYLLADSAAGDAFLRHLSAELNMD